MNNNGSKITWHEALMPKYRIRVLVIPLVVIWSLQEYVGASQDFLIGNALGTSAFSCILAWVPAYGYWLFKRKRMPLLDYVIFFFMLLILTAFGTSILYQPNAY